MAGTGLPIPKSGDARTAPINVQDGDRLFDAQSWLGIAASGQQLARGAEGMLKVDAYQQKVRYYAEVDTADARKAAELRDKFANDPAGFDAAWQAHRDGALSETPAWALAQRTRTLGSYGNGAYSALLNEKRSTDKRLANDAWTALLGQTQNQVMGAALAGTLNNPDGIAAIEKYRGIVQSGVAGQLIAPEEGDRRIANLTSTATVYAARGAVKETFASSGAVAAQKFIDETVRDENLALSPEQRFGLGARLRADVHAWEAERQANIAPVKLEAQELLAAKKNGAPVSQERLDQTVERFKRLGAVADAADLLTQARYTDDAAVLARMPISQSAALVGAMQDRAGFTRGVSGPVGDIITREFAAAGLDPALGRVIARIESGGDPNAVTRSGTYKGLFQFSDAEFAKYGGGGNILNPADNARAAARKTAAEIAQFQENYGRAPTPTEIYLQHQQGVAGLAAHLRNPDAPAWQNMLSTGEGKQKGEKWARAAIWDNIPDSAKAQFGAVDNVSSAQFVALWRQRVEGVSATSPADIKFVGEQTKALRDRVTAEVDLLARDMREKGTIPDQDRLSSLLSAAETANDTESLLKVRDMAAEWQYRRDQGRTAPTTSAAVIEAGRQQGATLGVSKDEAERQRIAEEVHQAKVTGLKSDPLDYTIKANGEVAGMAVPEPLNPSDSQMLRAGLANRAAWARQGQSVYQQGPMPALTSADATTLNAALEGADPRGQARILADITAAIPDQATRNATFAKLGEKSADAMVKAYAGTLYARDPALGESILRGQRAIQADPRNNPVKQDRSNFTDALDKALPQSAFTQSGRTNPSGAWATMRSVVVARYADLTASDPGASKDFNEDRLIRAVQDVTGGVLKFNSGSVIAPVRGMTQSQFDTIITGLTDADLRGVTTLSGAPITANYLRRNARLESLGEDRYLVQVGIDPASPQYAMYGAETENPSPFILNLAGRVAGRVPRRGTLRAVPALDDADARNAARFAPSAR